MPLSDLSLDTVVKFARRKGFVFQSSEIYGGFAATYDFGQLGVMLKKNLVEAWKYWMITSRTDVLEIEGAIFLHPKVWEASGHIGSFADLMCDDLSTKKRYRADHLIEDAKVKMPAQIAQELGTPELTDKIIDNAGGFTIEQADFVIKYYNLKSPEGNPLSTPKKFNLLVKTHLGPVEDDASLVYLKGESCQNIYVDWKQVQETSRKKLPFGIAQLGKAFRNEITVKQYMFRTREFEQIDLQFFVKPHTENEWFEYWKQYRYDFYTKFLGFSTESLSWHQHDQGELAFYAADAWDIYFKFGELGFKEMEGVHNRTDYDTRQHQTFSGTDLTYLDPETNEKYLPYIVEMSLGVSRLFLASLFEFYDEEELADSKGEKDVRVVLRFPFDIAPYKVAVLPLMKKDGLGEKAQSIFADLRRAGIMADYDEAGSVGKRYRRQDENGTPWCVTVDYETLDQNHADFGTVTLRHRDTMTQTRVKIEDIKNHLNKEKFGK